MNVASQNQNNAMTQAAQGLMGLGLMGASGGFDGLFGNKRNNTTSTGGANVRIPR